MTLSWDQNGRRLDTKTVIHALEEEQHAWQQAADEVSKLRSQLPQPEQGKADEHIRWCRARSEALRKMVVRLCDVPTD